MSIHEPFLFQSLNRSAVLITAKQPYIDWVNSFTPADVNFILSDNDIYLLPEFEEASEIDDWIELHFDEIFCDQLNNWQRNDMCWPGSRSFKLFQEWFTYTTHTMILDTVKGRIAKL